MTKCDKNRTKSTAEICNRFVMNPSFYMKSKNGISFIQEHLENAKDCRKILDIYPLKSKSQNEVLDRNFSSEDFQKLLERKRKLKADQTILNTAKKLSPPCKDRPSKNVHFSHIAGC